MSWNLQLSARVPPSKGHTNGDINLRSSNYMNNTDDGLFSDAEFHMNMDGKKVSDDMALSYAPSKNHRNQMSGLLYAGNTQSLPPGLPPGSIAKYNMTTNPSATSDRFMVEHLASFPQDAEHGYLTPAEALIKLKKISSGGGLWAQKMNMIISTERLYMLNSESSEVIEEYPMDQISLCITVTDDEIFDHLLIYSTRPSKEKVGAIHLFQCKGNEASVINEVVNKHRELKASQYMDMIGGFTSSASVSASSSEAELSSPRPGETRTEWNLQQRHAVARAVEAFQTSPPEEPLNNNTIMNTNGHMTDAKISRDVEILNKCIEEVENFVVMLKRINEARKQLQQRKSKGSKKKKIENILILQCQPPPDHRIFDVYQKFKHSLNLLGKLQAHISDPSAPELIHYLFVPLGIIVKVTGIDKARAVVDPLLTVTAVDFLENCLDSREYNFWQSLGPNWTMTRNSEPFKDRYFQPYIPIFADGWVPPEIVSPQQEAAAKSTVAMVARMQESSGLDQTDRRTEVNTTPPEEHQVLVTRISKMSTVTRSEDPIPSSVQQKKMYKIGIVVYDYMAHNNKELTIRAGERIQIIDDSRRWWLVRNSRNEQGYVPSTVLEIPAVDQPPLSSPLPNHDMHDEYTYLKRSSSGQSYDSNHDHTNQIRRSSSGYDSTKNYVNEHISSSHPVPQPVKSTTPVHIVVQLPDDRNQNGFHGVNSSGSMSQTGPPHAKPPRESPPYAVALSRKVSNGFGGGEPATGELLNGVQYSGYQRSTAVIKTQSSPPTVIHEEAMPPAPPPPPPPAAAPPPPAVVKSYTPVTKAQKTSPHEPVMRRDNSGELHSELKNRLSMVQADGTLKKAEQSERKELVHVQTSVAHQNVSQVDTVDVFIPLYKSSTADDVSRWLAKLGFSQKTIEALKGKTALELFSIKKDVMVDLLGNTEGLQLYEELQVQNGAKPRHQTMTELQKALVKRVQKREVQHEIAKTNNPTQQNDNIPTGAPAVKAKPPPVKVKTVSPKTTPPATTTDQPTSLTISSVIQSVEPKQVTVNSTKNEAPMVTLSDQASLIRKQKEELERLKRENPDPARDPGKATFSSFSGNINAATPQGKTQL